jgi:hypothetical protein
MIKGKYLLWGAIGAAGLAGGAYLLNLNRLSSELEIAVKALIHRVSLTGLKLRVDVILKNPTGGTVKVKYPFVKLMYGTGTLGSSEVKDQDFEIPKFGQVAIEPVFIDLGFLSLASSAPNVLKEYRETGGFTLTVKTVTTINNRIPHTKTDAIVVGSSQ